MIVKSHYEYKATLHNMLSFIKQEETRGGLDLKFNNLIHASKCDLQYNTGIRIHLTTSILKIHFIIILQYLSYMLVFPFPISKGLSLHSFCMSDQANTMRFLTFIQSFIP
jgi:hypothetical protein